ncbi:MAG: hypothetical protein V2I43_08225 [Parvularcula sp.]|nr:hypothetical protein [Parvularcula sp.]
MAIILILLVIIQVALATRHDQVVATSGPQATLEALKHQIKGREATLADLESELQKRRDAFANIGDIAAEYDALVRQRDEVLTEWNQMEDRREEIRNLREETENTLNEYMDASAKKQEKEGESQALEAGAIGAESRLKELLLREEKASSECVATESKMSDLKLELASVENQLRQARHDIEDLGTRRVRAEAQIAAQEKRAETDEPAEDRLRELSVRPPVLQELESRQTRDRWEESEALDQLARHFRRLGLDYHPRTQRAFHTAMKVSETTQLAVLAGISGTGKSQLPRQYAAAMGMGFLQIPVQPRWDSPQDLMGFYNYIEGRFRPTDMARMLWQLDTINNPNGAIKDRMALILLDEMNLARVEYYFSDFLSRLESRPDYDKVRDTHLRKDAEIELEIPMPSGVATPRLFPGYNLLFAGTMNEDESTQSLSDKVVDRANVIRFAAPKKLAPSKPEPAGEKPRALTQESWRKWIRKPQSETAEHLDKMLRLMKSFQRPFGHRMGLAISTYVANYPDLDGRNDLDAFADQVEMRLLPKLRGIELDVGNNEAYFRELTDFVDQDLGDTLLAEAIKQSVDKARDTSGQFVWTGVSR